MRLYRHITHIALIAILFFPAGVYAAPAQTPTELTAQINTILKKYPKVIFAGDVRTSTGEILFSKNATIESHPASNMKLFTTSAALATLGEDFTFTTTLYGARPINGIVNSDLILYGRGDPTLMDTDIRTMVQALVAQGVKTINGSIVGDESYLTGSMIPPGRTAADLQSYFGAEVSALSVYENLVSITIAPAKKVGSRPLITSVLPSRAPFTIINTATTGGPKARSTFSIRRDPLTNIFRVSGVIPSKFRATPYYFAVHDPALYATVLLREALTQYGIAVTGVVRTTSAPTSYDTLTELAEVTSDPLTDIVTETNKRSNNLFAELLLRQVGRNSRTDTSTQTDEALGIAAIQEYLKALGVPDGSVDIFDGSGLGRGQSATPAAMTTLLGALKDASYGDALIASLPIGGVDGTLTRRFKGTSGAGTILAKTGTLNTVDTLSGIVRTLSGNDIVFSLFTTHAAKSPQGKALVNSITLALSDYASTH